MKRTNVTGLAVTVLMTTLIVVAILQWRTIHALRAELPSLRDSALEASRLREENARLARVDVDAAELERLKAERSELQRLRGQVGQLRQELRTSAEQQARERAPVMRPDTIPHPNSETGVVTHTAQVAARVAGGGTLVMGGWSTAPGRRSFLLMTPAVQKGSSESREASVRCMAVEASDNALQLFTGGDLAVEGHDSSLQNSVRRRNREPSGDVTRNSRDHRTQLSSSQRT